MDRDGVLNQVVVDPEHGTIDSPLHPDQVRLIDGVPGALKALQDSGYDFSIVTNQPSAAKGKTTRALLERVHQRVLDLAQAEGAVIFGSEICFHRSEDRCKCRKPGTLMLENSIARYRDQTGLATLWMVGDGVTDVEAGAKLGLRTAFLGPKKCDACKIFEDRFLSPAFWGKNLLAFSQFLVKTSVQSDSLKNQISIESSKASESSICDSNSNDQGEKRDVSIGGDF